MSRAREHALQMWEWTRLVDWYFSMEALVRAPHMIFAEYVPDPNREYARGNVVREGQNKWLLQNWGRLDPNIPLGQQNLLKLFRGGERYEWVREEYCIKGYERSYEGVWYRVISERVDDSTPPPNSPQNWLKIS